VRLLENEREPLRLRRNKALTAKTSAHPRDGPDAYDPETLRLRTTETIRAKHRSRPAGPPGEGRMDGSEAALYLERRLGNNAGR
jgi:hypothetical protein